METDELSQIRGTVVQRTFLPRGLSTTLNIATVPLSDVNPELLENLDGEAPLRQMTSEILAVPPDTIIDNVQYGQLGKLIRGGSLHQSLRRAHFGPYWRHFYDEYFARDTTLSRTTSPRIRGSLGQLSRDSLCLMLSSQRSLHNFPLFHPLALRTVAESSDFRKLDLTTDALQMGLNCYFSSRFAEPRVLSVVDELYNYDIPFGRSPGTGKKRLSTLVKKGEKMCLAPLAVATGLGIKHLLQEEFAAALFTVGTGSGMTLILVGTFFVTALLLRHLRTRVP